MADVIAARLAGVLRQQQQLQAVQPVVPQQRQPQQQQLAEAPRQPVTAADGLGGKEEDLSSSFGDFSCLQDLQSLLDSC